jgi:hypothetical protein
VDHDQKSLQLKGVASFTALPGAVFVSVYACKGKLIQGDLSATVCDWSDNVRSHTVGYLSLLTFAPLSLAKFRLQSAK